MRVVHEARTPAEWERLRDAALATRGVRPPGIVRVVTIAADRVVTDEADGRGQPQSFADAARVVALLHRAGVAHGAIDAELVRVDAVGRAVLPLPAWSGRRPTIEDDVTALCKLAGVRARSASELAQMLAASETRLLARPRHRHGPIYVAFAAIAVAGAAVALVLTRTPPRAANQPASPPRTVPATEDRVVTADGHRYVIGDPGDLAIVGRWRCGPARPVLIRPRTGDVLVFNAYSDAATATPVTRLAGVTGAGRAKDDAGCDVLVVDVSERDGGARRPRSPATVPIP